MTHAQALGPPQKEKNKQTHKHTHACTYANVYNYVYNVYKKTKQTGVT